MRRRPAWTSYWPSGLTAIGVFLLWTVQRELFDRLAGALGIPAEMSALGLLIGLAPIAAGVLYHHFTHLYEIQGGQRLRATRGFIARVRREFALSSQVQVDLRQSAIGRLLGYGTVRFWTGDDRSGLEWTNVRDPAGIVDAIHAMRATASAPASTETGATSAAPAAAPAAIHPAPTLEAATRTKRTDFGPAVAVAEGPATAAPATIDTPLGQYLAHADGTVTHRPSRLSIIRAPWGMVWDGTRFTGEPIRLGWDEAVRLFGRGTAVPYAVGGTMARFDEAKRAASAFHHGFKKGICRVDFAGYQDWRLPTADELERLFAAAMSEDGGVERGWRWGGEHNARVVQRLYPEFAGGRPALWTATGLGGTLAWAFDGSLPVGDMQTKTPMSVMLVRDTGPLAS